MLQKADLTEKPGDGVSIEQNRFSTKMLHVNM